MLSPESSPFKKDIYHNALDENLLNPSENKPPEPFDVSSDGPDLFEVIFKLYLLLIGNLEYSSCFFKRSEASFKA